MSFTQFITQLGAAGAGGESSWMAKISYTSVYPSQVFYDSDNEFVIAMGTSGNDAIQITLNAQDGEYKTANYPRLRVHDTGETFSRPKVCRISANTYGYSMYNYDGSYERGHIKTGDINFANGDNQLDIYRSGIYKGGATQCVGDGAMYVAFDYYSGTSKIVGGGYNSVLSPASRFSKYEYYTGNTLYIRDMAGNSSTRYSCLTHATNAGQGEYALMVLAESGGYKSWSKQFKISSKSTQAGECKSIVTNNSDRVIAVGNTEPASYSEMFVARLATSDGSASFQNSYYSGNFHYYSYSVAIESGDDSIYVCGFKQTTNNTGIIMKLSATGVFMWGLQLSSTQGPVEVLGIDVDNNGNLYFQGFTTESGNRKLIVGKIPNDGSTSGTYSDVTFSSITMTKRNSPTTHGDVTVTFDDNANALEQGNGDSQIDLFTDTSTVLTNL